MNLRDIRERIARVPGVLADFVKGLSWQKIKFWLLVLWRNFLNFRNTTDGWGWPARLLHWVVGVVIIIAFGIGFYTAEILDDVYARLGWVQTHKSWGFLAGTLVAVRLAWRAFNPAPAMPDSMTPVEKRLAHLGHYGLYAAIVGLPLTGWLMVTSSPLQEMAGIKNMVFGLFEMPDFLAGNAELSHVFHWAHWVCGVALAVLLVGHVGAALKHHFINKDNVLRRMIIGR